ncbi:tetratricopeptide repeat protein, partial [Rhodothermus sp. AH-315-K08]|nr:tetratricopeptide repeat protein [Rhodothermus sp. AH-315-K08]
ALLRRATGRRDEAEALLREQLPVRRRFATQEPSLLGLTLTNLGTVLHERGAHAEAEEALREAVEIYSEQDRARPTEASARQNLAAALGAQGKWEEAEEQFLNALAVRESIYPANDMRIATVRNNIASMWRRAESPERAEPEFRKAVEIARSNPNADWRARAQMEVNWGWTLLVLNRSAEAGTVFRGLIGAAESGEAVPRRIVFDTYWGLGRAQAAQRSFAAAEESFQSAIAMVGDILRDGDPLEWRLQVQYAEFLIGAGRPEQAATVLSVAVDSLEATDDSDAPKARRLLEGLGRK